MMTPPKSEQFRPPDVDLDDVPEGIDMSRWKVDRHVPVALLIAISVQTGGAFWWGGVTSTRLEGLERDRLAALQTAETAAKATTALSERVVEIKIRLDGAVESLAEIKALLRQTSIRP